MTMSESKKTILIVDDDAELREGLVSLFEDENLKLEQASNGEEALAVIASCTIDLVITDILMPLMDGIELTLKLKAIQPDLQVILISGGGRQLESHHKYDYLALGKKLTSNQHVLKKPFSAQALIDLSSQLLARQV